MKVKKQKAGLSLSQKKQRNEGLQIPFTFFSSLQSKQIFVSEAGASRHKGLPDTPLFLNLTLTPNHLEH
jgi:hypothetical protein